LDQGVIEDFSNLQKNYYYQRVGGVPLVGIQKTVVVAHGCSDAFAIFNAIRAASHLVETQVFERMSDELKQDPTVMDLKNYHTQGMLERWKSKWGFSAKKT
jgi:fatty acid/phospholipid biosynthesis enzyme